MDKSEILQYVEISRAKSIIIDRSCMYRYPGYIREIVIRDCYTVRLEYNTYNCEYGGLTFYLLYFDYEGIIISLENFLKKPISEWENISKTGFYPIIPEPFNIDKSSQTLKEDFINNNLQLPTGFYEKRIPEGYWKDLYNNKFVVSVESENLEVKNNVTGAKS